MIDKFELEIIPEKNIIVLGEDQKVYFQQLKATLDILGFASPTPIHYSFVLLTDGKMSTRKGNVVLLEDFMKEAINKANEEIKKRYEKADMQTAKMIAYGAVKYAILKVSNEKNVVFDLDSALNFEGDTGPYLLYSYARARSILKKAKYRSKKFTNKGISQKEKQLIIKIGDFQDIVAHAYSTFSPNLIANYAFELAQNFNEFYHACPVIGSENEDFRLCLVDASSQVLKNALSLLGIEVIEKM